MKRFIVPSLLLSIVLMFSTFGYGQTILLQEAFEGSFPPAGWTIVNNVMGGTWQSNVARGVPNYLRRRQRALRRCPPRRYQWDLLGHRTAVRRTLI